MSINEITATVHELRELLRMEEELNSQIEALKDQIKAHMTGEGTDTLSGTDYKVTWKEVESTRFDTIAFKKAHADLYAAFSGKTVSKRFLVK